MSKANSALKVLKVAYNRVSKRWGKNKWSRRGTDENGQEQYFVCLEGAITGGCTNPNTQAQVDALEILRDILQEDTGDRSIPAWNDDQARTKDDVLNLIKRGIIRLETDKAMKDVDDDYIDEDETEDILKDIRDKMSKATAKLKSKV
jgi:hypothetical protein